MAAFIINFQSPLELEDLVDRYERDGLTNIDHILNFGETPGEWTVHRDARTGDRVFFMCAVTSKGHMGHVCAEARRHADDEVVEYAERERELHRRYAGHVVAVGRVASGPFRSDDAGYAHAARRNPWYAAIGDFELLDSPVPIARFRDFVRVSRTGSSGSPPASSLANGRGPVHV